MRIPKTSLRQYKFAELQKLIPEIENKQELIDDLRKDIDSRQAKLEGFDYFMTANKNGVEYISAQVNDRIMGGMKKTEWLIFMLENPEMYNELFPIKEKKTRMKKI